MALQESEWFKMAPYLYTTIASAPLANYKRIHNVCFLREQKFEKSFKFQAYDFLMTATTTAGNGAFSFNKLDVPLLTSIHDDRLKSWVHKQNEILFENPISIVEEIITNNSKNPQNIFFAINQDQKSLVNLYSLNSILKQKSEAIKPRQQLEGDKTVTVLKSRRQDLIVGREDGCIDLYNLSRGDKIAQKFQYHRGPVIDVCWLSTNERVEDKIFISTSPQINSFFLWDKRKEQPAMKINHQQHSVNTFLFMRNNVFLSGGDPNIKYWDLRNTGGQSFKLEGQNESVTKLCKVDGNQPRTEKFMFASGGNKGEVLIWEDSIEFYHGAHNSKIQELSFSKECDFFVSVEEQIPALNVWKPYSLSNMLK